MNSNQNLMRGLKLVDLVTMIACFTFAAVAVLTLAGKDIGTIRDILGTRISIGNFLIFAVFPLSWHLLFCAFGLYDDLLLSGVFHKAKDVLKATSIGTCIIVGLAVPFQISFIDTTFMVIFWSSTSLLAFSVRYTLRKMLVRSLENVENRRKVLIVGVNSRSLRLARRLEASNENGCKVIGFVDDTTLHALNFASAGYPVVASFAGLAEYLAKTSIDEVLVCLPVQSRADDMKAVVATCEEQGIAYGVLRDLFKLDLSRSAVRQLDEQLLITVYPHSISNGQAAIKRVFDLVLSFIFIVLLAPVFLVTALLIKLTSPGPAIFVQERVGLNKKLIRVFKFRTMVPNAEAMIAELEQYNEAEAPAFKMKNDPRVIPIGRFLRKSSIDELPQLFNVLLGDMSLVGPRPLAVRDYSGLDKDWHRRRVSIRPGVTGIWQVSGRDSSSFDDWMKLDLQYIDRWSLLLDIKLLIQTIPAVLRGKGAV
jgi:exopolysaccharide biosynthesis polyprenyl glycosylphosphotransferase